MGVLCRICVMECLATFSSSQSFVRSFVVDCVCVLCRDYKSKGNYKLKGNTRSDTAASVPGKDVSNVNIATCFFGLFVYMPRNFSLHTITIYSILIKKHASQRNIHHYKNFMYYSVQIIDILEPF